MTSSVDLPRWCPRGQHHPPESHFRLLAGGKLARDCKVCEERRAAWERRKAFAKLPFDGLDMDRIYVSRGLMTEKQVRAARGENRHEPV